MYFLPLARTVGSYFSAHPAQAAALIGTGFLAYRAMQPWEKLWDAPWIYRFAEDRVQAIFHEPLQHYAMALAMATHVSAAASVLAEVLAPMTFGLGWQWAEKGAPGNFFPALAMSYHLSTMQRANQGFEQITQATIVGFAKGVAVAAMFQSAKPALGGAFSAPVVKAAGALGAGYLAADWLSGGSFKIPGASWMGSFGSKHGFLGHRYWSQPEAGSLASVPDYLQKQALETGMSLYQWGQAIFGYSMPTAPTTVLGGVSFMSGLAGMMTGSLPAMPGLKPWADMVATQTALSYAPFLLFHQMGRFLQDKMGDNSMLLLLPPAALSAVDGVMAGMLAHQALDCVTEIATSAYQYPVAWGAVAATYMAADLWYEGAFQIPMMHWMGVFGTE